RSPLAGLPQLVDVGEEPGLRRELLRQEVAVAQDDGEQVVEVVGEASGQLADGLHLLALAEPRLEPLTVGDVGRDPAHRVGAAVEVEEWEADGPIAARLAGADHLLLDLDGGPGGERAAVLGAPPLGEVGDLAGPTALGALTALTALTALVALVALAALGALADLRRPDLVVAPADDRVAPLAQQRLVMAVHQQVAARRVLDVDRRRAAVQDRLQQLLV